jgi:hypothetical protein
MGKRVEYPPAFLAEQKRWEEIEDARRQESA